MLYAVRDLARTPKCMPPLFEVDVHFSCIGDHSQKILERVILLTKLVGILHIGVASCTT